MVSQVQSRGSMEKHLKAVIRIFLSIGFLNILVAISGCAMVLLDLRTGRVSITRLVVADWVPLSMVICHFPIAFFLIAIANDLKKRQSWARKGAVWLGAPSLFLALLLFIGYGWGAFSSALNPNLAMAFTLLGIPLIVAGYVPWTMLKVDTKTLFDEEVPGWSRKRKVTIAFIVVTLSLLVFFPAIFFTPVPPVTEIHKREMLLDFKEIIKAQLSYILTGDGYADSLDILANHKGISLDDDSLIDPWGQKYILQDLGDRASLFSIGPDGQPGTKDDFRLPR